MSGGQDGREEVPETTAHRRCQAEPSARCYPNINKVLLAAGSHQCVRHASAKHVLTKLKTGQIPCNGWLEINMCHVLESWGVNQMVGRLSFITSG